MSHEHHHNHPNHQTHPKQKGPIHRDWRYWTFFIVVLLMLASMFMYVGSDDEELQPGGQVGPAVPAAE